MLEQSCPAGLVDKKGGRGPGQPLEWPWQVRGDSTRLDGWLVMLTDNQAFGKRGVDCSVILLAMAWEIVHVSLNELSSKPLRMMGKGFSVSLSYDSPAPLLEKTWASHNEGDPDALPLSQAGHLPRIQ